MQIRSFWVDIENSSGVKLGAGPLRALNFSVSGPLSACGEFSFDVSSADPNRSALLEKRVAVCRYVNMAGQIKEFGGGVIDKITLSIAEDGSLIWHVKGNDKGRELSYRSVGSLDLTGGGGAGVTDAPAQIMALAPAGWTIADGSTLTSVYAGFDGESVLAALTRVSEKSGEHWRLEPGRVVQWLGPASAFEASGVRAVQQVNAPVAAETVDNIALITSLEEESDATELLTRVIPRGSGNGGVALTLEAATDTPPAGYTLNKPGNYVKRDASETTYGRIERALEFKDIGPLSNTTPDIQAAANALLQASVEHLRRYGTPQKFYKLGIICNQALKSGTTIHVVYRKLQDGVVTYDLNGVFNILKAERQITSDGICTVGITISTIDRLPVTDESFLASQVVGSRVLSAHQQLSASTDTLTFRDEMDSAHGASLRFWLGDEYTSLNRVFVRFRIQPLRSTVKSVAAETTTSSSDGESTQTSSSGGGQTATGGSHLHNTTIVNHAGNKTVNWYEDSGFVSPVVASGGPLIFQVGVNESHSHEIAAHTHTVDTPAHTHEVTPVINTIYGIFEEGGDNTLALTDLIIKVNGGADMRTSVVDMGSSWYELDLTDALTDSVFRPAQENNEVSITTAVSKTARIEAQITVRGVVQAVKYD
jgi:hypothetical protein